MKFSFKNLIYAIILIGFITLSFTLCSKQVFHPIFEKKPDFQDSIVFQASHGKLLGKKLFVVSVVAVLDDTITEEIELAKQPQVVSTNNTVTLASSQQEEGVGYSKIRPNINEIRAELKQQKTTTFSLDSIKTPTIDLPGFPSLPEQVNNQQKEQTTIKNVTPTTQWVNPDASLEPNKALVNKKSESSTSTEIIINETLTTSSQKPQTIKHYIISIVIDQDFFSYLDIETAELETLVYSVSGINYDRGDKLSISLAPFVDKGFSWNYFVKKNKVVFEKIVILYEKLQPILIVILTLIGVIALGLFLKRLINWLIKVQKERAIINEKKRIEQKEKEKENQLSAIEEKKQALIQLGQSKPDQFILLLNSWMEVDNG